jgi:hypothetical protein
LHSLKNASENGYPFDEVASALRKSIRRGLEEDAMFWAVEMETRFPDYLWKRLQVISKLLEVVRGGNGELMEGIISISIRSLPLYLLYIKNIKIYLI